MRIENLALKYGDKLVFEGVTCEVPNKQVTALLGCNGVGKTSLLKCILGLLNTYQGQIFLEDRDLKDLTYQEKSKKMAYVPQLATLFPDLLLSDFLAVSGAEQELALELTKLREYQNMRLNELSGGLYRKALIASAIAQGTDFIFFDEPTVFLDPIEKQELARVITALRDQHGKTILFVSHDLEFVLENADHLLALKDQSLVLDASCNGKTAEELFKEVYA